MAERHLGFDPVSMDCFGKKQNNNEYHKHGNCIIVYHHGLEEEFQVEAIKENIETVARFNSLTAHE